MSERYETSDGFGCCSFRLLGACISEPEGAVLGQGSTSPRDSVCPSPCNVDGRGCSSHDICTFDPVRAESQAELIVAGLNHRLVHVEHALRLAETQPIVALDEETFRGSVKHCRTRPLCGHHARLLATAILPLTACDLAPWKSGN